MKNMIFVAKFCIWTAKGAVLSIIVYFHSSFFSNVYLCEIAFKEDFTLWYGGIVLEFEEYFLKSGWANLYPSEYSSYLSTELSMLGNPQGSLHGILFVLEYVLEYTI